MKRIRDAYELPDDDDDGEGSIGSLLRRPRRSRARLIAGLAAVVLLAGFIASLVYVSIGERNDEFCIGCHIPPEQAYFERGNAATGGALAADLASLHYQQIRGQGGDIRCINCHEGDGSASAFVDKRIMSAGNLARWLSGQFNPQVEKYGVRALHLANDGCAACHSRTLLLAGARNHYHNMLPAAYTIWKNGGRLIAPADVKDMQGIIAAGLALYDTTVTCSTCHQAHRATELFKYLEPQAVRVGCIQCHLETSQGPADVTYNPEE